MSYTPEQEKLYTWHYKRLENAITFGGYYLTAPTGGGVIQQASHIVSARAVQSVEANEKFKQLFERALKKDFPVNFIPYAKHYTLLTHAVEKMNEGLAWLLLDHGADVNVDGDFCLMCAAQVPFMSPELFRRIEEDTKPENKDMTSPWSRWRSEGIPVITPLRALVQNYVFDMRFYRTRTASDFAAQANRLERLRILLEAGWEIGDLDENYFRNHRSFRQPENEENLQNLLKFVYSWQEQNEQQNLDSAPVYYDYEL